MLVHTHASEQREETDLVRQRFGVSNIQLLANLGLAETNACLAHCVWPEPEEFEILASGGASVVHCPSCNLKLSSGVAPIADYLCRMVENDKPRGLTKGRLFILIFFGLAIVLSITTILGTWDGEKNGVVDPSTMNNPLTAPAAGK